MSILVHLGPPTVLWPFLTCDDDALPLRCHCHIIIPWLFRQVCTSQASLPRQVLTPWGRGSSDLLGQELKKGVIMKGISSLKGSPEPLKSLNPQENRQILLVFSHSGDSRESLYIEKMDLAEKTPFPKETLSSEADLGKSKRGSPPGESALSRAIWTLFKARRACSGLIRTNQPAPYSHGETAEIAPKESFVARLEPLEPSPPPLSLVLKAFGLVISPML